MKTQGRQCLDGEMGWHDHWLIKAIPDVDDDLLDIVREDRCERIRQDKNKEE